VELLVAFIGAIVLLAITRLFGVGVHRHRSF
jgi:hypothetical protein